MSHGVLIGPKAEDATVLDEYEYNTALKAVQFMRSTDASANSIATALSACKNGEEADEPYQGMSRLASFLHQLMVALAEDRQDEAEGMFVEFAEPPTLLLTHCHNGADRLQCIKGLLKILDRRWWLENFLLTAIPHWADNRPTPLDIIWRLSEHASYFESDIDAAKRMQRDWPHLFGSQPVIVECPDEPKCPDKTKKSAAKAKEAK